MPTKGTSKKFCKNCALAVRSGRKRLCRVDGEHKAKKNTCNDHQPVACEYEGPCERCGGTRDNRYMPVCLSCQKVIKEAEDAGRRAAVELLIAEGVDLITPEKCVKCDKELVQYASYVDGKLYCWTCAAVFKRVNLHTTERFCTFCGKKALAQRTFTKAGLVCVGCALRVKQAMLANLTGDTQLSRYCSECKTMSKDIFIRDSLWGDICKPCWLKKQNKRIKHTKQCKSCGKDITGEAFDTCSTCWDRSYKPNDDYFPGMIL